MAYCFTWVINHIGSNPFVQVKDVSIEITKSNFKDVEFEM